MSTALDVSAAPDNDKYLQAFISSELQEIFTAVVHPAEIWSDDPFDVTTIHQEARDRFALLLARLNGPTPPKFGKSLLLRGDPGSGKTHLLRAFRKTVHESGRGYFAYMQMTSATDNYPRYILSKLLDSLEEPYFSVNSTTGLRRLARAFFDQLDRELITDEDRTALLEGRLVPAELIALIDRIADFAVQDQRFAERDLKLLRAMLFLLPDDAVLRRRVMQWLRCEEMTERDSAMIGGLRPETDALGAKRMIIRLAKLIAAVHEGGPLVLCADQLEDLKSATDDEAVSGALFRTVVDTLIDLAEHVPTMIVVLACHSSHFEKYRSKISQSKLDRLLHDPTPISLSTSRTNQEILDIVAQRLAVLYGNADLPPHRTNRLFPFTDTDLARFAGQTPRQVLLFCRDHQERCQKARQWLPVPIAIDPVPPPPPGNGKIEPPAIDWDRLWNDFRTTQRVNLPVDDNDRAKQELAWAIRSVGDDLKSGHSFIADSDECFVEVTIQNAEKATQERFVLALMNIAAQGGGLGRRMQAAQKRAGELPLVLLRSTEFTFGKTSAVGKQMAEMMKQGTRRYVIADADWRAIHHFRIFVEKHKDTPGLSEWRRQARPLAQLPSLREILKLSELEKQPVPIAPPPPPPIPPIELDLALNLGETHGLKPSIIRFTYDELTKHMAFLGGSGSGKTTAALVLIEQLLEGGVPVVMIDRKGDLARYADGDAWGEPTRAPRGKERLPRLRERLDIALFTPGQPQGRDLAIPLVPGDFADLSDTEREEAAGYTAAALERMLGIRRELDPMAAILRKSLEVLGAAGEAITLTRLIELINARDDELILAVGGSFDDRHYKNLTEKLTALMHLKGRLLTGEAESLDFDFIFRRGRPARTPLTIINTAFLRSDEEIDFWMTQFLTHLLRWGKKHPKETLQAVCFLDEADRYLPAVGKPATKQPMLDLLKRSRSAGLSLFLATQNTGDFDYNCREQIAAWLLGRITQDRSLEKIRNLLSERPDVEKKLPNQQAGQFHLVRGGSVVGVNVFHSLIATEQLPESRVLALAASGSKASNR